MNLGKVPELAWSDDEMAQLPNVYVDMILLEHEKESERHYDKIAWKRKQDEEKAKNANAKH